MQSPVNSDAAFKALTRALDDGVFVVDSQGVVTSCNAIAEQLFGFDDGAMTGARVDALIDPAGWGEIAARTNLADHPERPTKYGISRAMVGRRHDGTAFPVRLTAARIDAAGGVVVVCRPATPEAEPDDLTTPALRSRISQILSASPDAIILIDDTGLIALFSAAAERLFGYAERDVVGKNVSILMPDPYRAQHDEYLERYHRTGEKRIIGIGRVVVGRRQNGDTFPMELNIGEFWTRGRRHYVGFVHDITRRQGLEKRANELQAELLQVSRLSAMGQMAAIVAHELNQPLTATTNYLKAAERVISQQSHPDVIKARDLMAKAAAQSLRAGGIISRMRDAIHKGDEAWTFTTEDLNRVVQESLALSLAGSEHEGVILDVALSAVSPKVKIDRVPIQEAISNLVRNAIEAMRAVEHRRLTISTGVKADGFAEVVIADTGPGLAPNMGEKMFEPFFTTKPTGTGLGLSICKSIVDGHGGRLWTEPTPGGGATFRLTVPLADGEGRNP